MKPSSMHASHAISRADFLRTLGRSAVGIAGALATMGASATARSKVATGEVDVYPTGVFPSDVLEVTAAVNGGVGPSGQAYPGGGVVRLKAAMLDGTPMYFNFGGDYTGFPGPSNPGRGTVRVLKDVTILGELTEPVSMSFPSDPAPPLASRPDRTVVYGGKRAFSCPAASPNPTSLTVRNVFFAYPSLAAVQVAKSAGLEVSNCVVYDIKPDDTGLILGGIPFWGAFAIEATGIVSGAQHLYGEFRIMNNRIRRISPSIIPPTPIGAGFGISANYASMSGHILANDLEGFPFLGVGLSSNDGAVTIAANRIRNCGYGTQPTACGIGARATTGPILIERNSVTGGPAGTAMSFPSKNAISLASSSVVVRANIVEGTFAAQAIFLGQYANAGTTWFATGDRFENNDLSQSTAARAQVLVQSGCDRNRFTNNDYGFIGSAGLAGVVVQSAGNALVNEDFWGAYSGLDGQPCVLLTSTSTGNSLAALKYQGAPQGFDVCDQVLDQGANEVPGRQKCN